MPYNTRRKSLSLPSLGIHIPVTHTARTKSGSRPSLSSGGSSPLSDVPSDMDSHPSKRLKRAHPGKVPEEALEQTPPPSPTVAASIEMTDAPSKIDLDSINDDIVEAVVSQLQATANRPHLVKELATVLGQSLTSVQQSANPCAIISSRLASYMKRPCWSALSQCPLAKELESVHPRRTYFFLTTLPRQPIPDSSAPAIVTPIIQPALVTPSVSLTDDSVSDDVEGRRRELSPSPEVDLSPTEFDESEDIVMPGTPVVSIPSQRNSRARSSRRHDSPPLEKDEREFTQTADVLLKRKLSREMPGADAQERVTQAEYGFRDEIWFAADSRLAASVAVFNSPAIKPSTGPIIRKDDDGDSWAKFSKLSEWDMGAESIEIEELDFLFSSY